MNFDLFSTGIAVWTGGFVLFGLISALLAELDRPTPVRRGPSPENEPTEYRKAA